MLYSGPMLPQGVTKDVFLFSKIFTLSYFLFLNFF